MSKLILFLNLFRKNFKNYPHHPLEKNRFTVFFLILIIIFILSLKTPDTQGQKNILTNIIKDYIEETSVFASVENIDLSDNSYSENDVFLGGTTAQIFNKEKVNIPNIISGEAFLAYQSTFSIFNKKQRNEIITYTVQPGDTLSKIATDFGISINSLIWANQLKDSDYLSLGQELKIPPVSGIIHTVKKGDTVEKIAKEYSAKVDDIIDFNSLPKDGTLQLGQEIVVPGGKIKIRGRYVRYTSRTRFAHLPDLKGFFMLPTKGYNWGIIHGRNAIDVANICGTPIYAAASGKVIGARSFGWNGGAGKFVKILHNPKIETLYAHISRILVTPGQYVQKGQLIGLMGSTGLSTGCHLHFEVHGAKNPYAKY